ncbi:MAG: uroporphyrinogen decarboxylase, partial [Planctomycetales bacterium]|nr:uroporphyrinogen decarboxylase [Planctomycetales bacterium]
MTDRQWCDLLYVLNGELLDPLPVGLIVDCPWLPGWAGMSILDYLSNDRLWFEAN